VKGEAGESWDGSSVGFGVWVAGVEVGHVGEEGEVATPWGVVGNEVFAVLEDFAIALVGGFVFVELHPPEERGRILEKLVIERVLGDGLGKLVDFAKVGDVAALEGEGVEFFLGEAVGGVEFFEPFVVGLFLFEVGFGEDAGSETLTEVGEAEKTVEVAELVVGGIASVDGLESGGCGGGEEEIGAEFERLFDAAEGSAEARPAEPAAKDGGRGPSLRGRAGGVFGEGA